MIELVENGVYIVMGTYYSQRNDYNKIKVLEITKTTYFVEYLDGDNKHRYGKEHFEKTYEVVEVINTEPKEKVDGRFIITDRQIAHLRETVSRIHRQINLIRQGETHVAEKDRMDIMIDCCTESNNVLDRLHYIGTEPKE